jgi:hypothetical protein
MIEIRVDADGVIFLLDQIPKRVQEALHRKFQNIFAQLGGLFLEGVPGKFLDPESIKSDVSDVGSGVVGYIEHSDKKGVYAIYPSKYPFLYNKETKFFAYKVLSHPYLKGTPMIRRILHESKPWIVSEVEAAVREAL